MSRLVADIGGTNARFALCNKGSIDLENIRVFRCEQYPSPADAIKQYLAETNTSIETACLAVAGPVNEAEDSVRLTNNPWAFSKHLLAEQLGIRRLIAINDFVAAAMATTVIGSDDLFPLSPKTAFDLQQQRCILGPGTGLGVAGILPYQGKTLVVSTEGGNRSFAPDNEVEDYILHFLRAGFMIYGLWFMVYVLLVYGLWFIVYRLWLMFYWFMVFGLLVYG